MKTICLGALLALLCSSPAYAYQSFHEQGTSLRKLERGIANALLGGLEFARHLRQPDHGGVIPPWFKGIGISIFYTVKRTAAGLFEILTFPAGGQPLVEPEFVWQFPAKKT